MSDIVKGGKVVGKIVGKIVGKVVEEEVGWLKKVVILFALEFIIIFILYLKILS